MSVVLTGAESVCMVSLLPPLFEEHFVEIQHCRDPCFSADDSLLACVMLEPFMEDVMAPAVAVVVVKALSGDCLVSIGILDMWLGMRHGAKLSLPQLRWSSSRSHELLVSAHASYPVAYPADPSLGTEPTSLFCIMQF